MTPVTITVVGGNLWRIAAQQYGDSLAAARIAAANGLTDPVLSGQVTLIIPPRAAAPSDGLPPR